MSLDDPAAAPLTHHGLTAVAIKPRQMALRCRDGRLLRTTVVGEWRAARGRAVLLEYQHTSVRPAADFLPIGGAR